MACAPSLACACMLLTGAAGRGWQGGWWVAWARTVGRRPTFGPSRTTCATPSCPGTAFGVLGCKGYLPCTVLMSEGFMGHCVRAAAHSTACHCMAAAAAGAWGWGLAPAAARAAVDAAHASGCTHVPIGTSSHCVITHLKHHDFHLPLQWLRNLGVAELEHLHWLGPRRIIL